MTHVNFLVEKLYNEQKERKSENKAKKTLNADISFRWYWSVMNAHDEAMWVPCVPVSEKMDMAILTCETPSPDAAGGSGKAKVWVLYPCT